MIADAGRRLRLIAEETASSFRRNGGLTAASSLAFFSSIALIPALFLVTYLIGLTVGSSQTAFGRIQDILKQFIPGYSQDILREVRHLAAHKSAIGAVNAAVLLLSVLPLVSSLREVLARIFRRKPSRPFLLEKLYDLALTVTFLTSLAAIGVLGAAVALLQDGLAHPISLPAYLGGMASFLFFLAVVFLIYLAFSEGMPRHYLLAGALLSAGCWFLLRPLFHLFLAYNPGFGFAFGSFKSIFVVIIWLYYSLIVFLLGAEFASSLNRKDVAIVKRLVAGKRNIPLTAVERHLVRCQAGERIFGEGEAADRMFALLRGSVAIRRAERDIAVVNAGQYFGFISFLLGTQRTASAVAREDSEMAAISRENLGALLQESPELVLALLKEIALRHRETDRLIE